MSYDMFLDDERLPPTNRPGKPERDWVIVRSYQQAVDYIEENGFPRFISFDHDLGEAKETGYDFAKWLISQDIDKMWMPEDFDFYVHSQNPIGKLNIEKAFESYFNYLEMQSEKL
ncbi:hypothetical protein [Ralstonia phage RSP15]|uniref:hypothetical protein n=1 Tax=Ralstonia phage RSP15 TaxID=1785960 RepID=UPI00074D4395|nr:hypothetical protein BH754_gp142 [Ralstonia phage RSP15]BAU40164.1 hypothetical protein [Ralstonia phage RSP15]